MLVTTANVASLNRGLSKVFQSAYDSTPEFGSKIATTIRSNHAVEVHSFMKRLMAMREWIGPRVIDNLENNEYLLRNKTFEKTIGVPVNDIEDDSLGIYDAKFRMLAFAAKRWPDQQIKAALQAGTTELGFDGQAFFSTTHDIDPAGNQSNNFTSTALTAGNFETVRAAMVSYTGEDGEPLGVMPNLLVVAPQNEVNAREIVVAAYGSSGATNVQEGMAQILVIPELANEPTTWYLMDTNMPIKPLIWQLRQAPQLTAKTQMSDDNVFDDDEFKWGLKARGCAGYGPWWLAARAIA